MDLINQFIENYKKKMNFYETAGRMAARQLESALQAAGIRAIVTSRAKAPGRLKSKVLDGFDDLPDLCRLIADFMHGGNHLLHLLQVL